MAFPDNRDSQAAYIEELYARIEKLTTANKIVVESDSQPTWSEWEAAYQAAGFTLPFDPATEFLWVKDGRVVAVFMQINDGWSYLPPIHPNQARSVFTFYTEYLSFNPSYAWVDDDTLISYFYLDTWGASIRREASVKVDGSEWTAVTSGVTEDKFWREDRVYYLSFTGSDLYRYDADGTNQTLIKSGVSGSSIASYSSNGRIIMSFVSETIKDDGSQDITLPDYSSGGLYDSTQDVVYYTGYHTSGASARILKYDFTTNLVYVQSNPQTISEINGQPLQTPVTFFSPNYLFNNIPYSIQSAVVVLDNPGDPVLQLTDPEANTRQTFLAQNLETGEITDLGKNLWDKYRTSFPDSISPIIPNPSGTRWLFTGNPKFITGNLLEGAESTGILYKITDVEDIYPDFYLLGTFEYNPERPERLTIDLGTIPDHVLASFDHLFIMGNVNIQLNTGATYTAGDEFSMFFNELYGEGSSGNNAEWAYEPFLVNSRGAAALTTKPSRPLLDYGGFYLWPARTDLYTNAAQNWCWIYNWKDTTSIRTVLGGNWSLQSNSTAAQTYKNFSLWGGFFNSNVEIKTINFQHLDHNSNYTTYDIDTNSRLHVFGIRAKGRYGDASSFLV